MPRFSPKTIRIASNICTVDRHRPQSGSEYQDGFSRRAVCRECGCALVRTDAMRRWIRSGMLG